MLRKIGMLILLASMSWACPKGSEPWRDGVCVADIKPEGPTADESSKWVSDEKPPRNPQPAWETGEVKTVNLQNTDVAARSHPKDCKSDCIWTGARCLCNDDKDAGKKP